MRVLALALLLASCAALGLTTSKREPHPGLDKAVPIVWASYGRTDKPPAITVIEGKDLSCVDPNSGTPGFPVLLPSGWDCRNGYTVSPWACSVSWTGWPWSQTALAHELLHAAQARRGIVDPYHREPEWQTLVPAANDLLRAQGL